MLIRILSLLLIMNAVKVSGQGNVSDQIKQISDHLENANANEFIRSNVFTFSYEADTLRVHNKKVWKYDITEEYLEVIPIKNIKSVKSEKFYGTNSLVIMGKSIDEGFTRHILHRSQVTPSTHLFVSSDKDSLAFKRMELLLKSLMD